MFHKGHTLKRTRNGLPRTSPVGFLGRHATTGGHHLPEQPTVQNRENTRPPIRGSVRNTHCLLGANRQLDIPGQFQEGPGSIGDKEESAYVTPPGRGGGAMGNGPTSIIGRASKPVNANQGDPLQEQSGTSKPEEVRSGHNRDKKNG